MKFHVNVRVMLKKQLLDVQGRAVEAYLHQNQMNVSQMRVGKCFEFLIDAGAKDQAYEVAKKTIDSTLVNTLLEEYQFEMKEI